MLIDRKTFFESYRRLFKGALSQSQVDGLGAILSAMEAAGLPLAHMAYCLATVKHECADTWQPIAEYGKGKGRKYGKPDPKTGHVYYGRGYVQLTWAENYKKMGLRLGARLYETPDLALDPAIAARVMIVGMTEGSFTGKRLSDYITTAVRDYRNARRIINGTDKAELISGYALKFETILERAARPAAGPEPQPAPPPLGDATDPENPEGDQDMNPTPTLAPTGNSKIVWINALGIVFQVLALAGLEVPADIQARLAQIIAFVTGGATIAARTAATPGAANPPILSKINWTNILGMGAQLLPTIGLALPGGPVAIGIATNVASIVFRSFFTKKK